MFTSGFFNSVSSDRRYNAEQMSAIFDGLINDGIFDSIGDHFQVTPAASGLGVSVGTGRAWLNSTWSYNDSAYPITLSAASASLGRKDLICLKVDKSTNVRANSIVCITGTPASTPVEPTVSDDTTNGIYYHKLAAVLVAAGATSITSADITNYIGLSTGTPYVTGIIDSTEVDELWSQWDGEFNAWWEDIKTILDTDTVNRLNNRIDHITPKEATMNLYGFTHVNPPASQNYTYQAYSTDAILNQISSLLNNVKTLVISDLSLTASTESPYKTEYAFTEEPFLVLISKTIIYGLANYNGILESGIPVTVVLSPGSYFYLNPTIWNGAQYRTYYSSTSLSSDGLTLTIETAYYTSVASTPATCNYKIIYYH